MSSCKKERSSEKMEGGISVIDLEEIKGESQVLREACQKWGCFRVVNHGVPIELMAEMKSVAKDLFERPVEIKQRNKGVIAESGYLAPSEKNPHYESFGIFQVSNSDVVSAFCTDLEASPHERETIETYVKAINKLAVDIAGKMATSMGLSDCSFEDWPLQFRINKYAFTPETIGKIGIPLHTDSGFMTVLQDDENLGGLEVMDPSGIFVGVDPLPNSFLVNLGDTAVPWSNGELRNVQHLVKCKNAGIRYSVVTFMSPAPDKIIEAQPKFVDADHPRLYAPYTYAQFKKIRAAEKLHAGQALERILLKTKQPF